MNYHYFTHSIGGQMAPWQFLSEEQIQLILPVLKDKDVYMSIQAYDPDKNNKRCKIFLDFDGDNAAVDAIFMCETIFAKLGTYPEIYDSGRKGYHVILPVLVHGDNCEQIVKRIIKTNLNPGPTWDSSIYTSKRMWRIEGTLNTKGGRPKTRLYIYPKFSKEAFKEDIFNQWISEAREEENRLSSKPLRTNNILSIESDWKKNLRPCIQRMLTEPQKEGTRHNVIFFLARFFRYYGASAEEAIEIILKSEWTFGEEKHVERTVKSCYDGTSVPTFGCRNSEVAQDQCVPYLCFIKRED